MSALVITPNSLCTVKVLGDWPYNFVGEIMSMRTPANTCMVRTVPNHPGTLVELPIDRLAPAPRGVRYVHYARVNGNLRFPVDMLRYDQCTPVNFEVDEDGNLSEPNGNMEYGLWVASASSIAKSQFIWAIARWRSFSWEIEPMKTEKIR